MRHIITIKERSWDENHFKEMVNEAVLHRDGVRVDVFPNTVNSLLIGFCLNLAKTCRERRVPVEVVAHDSLTLKAFRVVGLDSVAKLASAS